MGFVNYFVRFSAYYPKLIIKNILNRSKSYLFSTMLKYSHSNFQLEILDNCDFNQLFEREQYYIELLSL